MVPFISGLLLVLPEPGEGGRLSMQPLDAKANTGSSKKVWLAWSGLGHQN